MTTFTQLREGIVSVSGIGGIGLLTFRAAEWSSGKNAGLLRGRPGFKPRVGSPKIFKIGFHQQKISILLIACDIKLHVEGALYSVFYAEASKRPWTSLN